MSTATLLVAALLLDAVLGEPKWLWSRLPHPAVLMGKLVNALDQSLNRGDFRRLKGGLTAAILIVIALLLGWLLSLLGPVAEIICAAILIAQRSLVDHVGAVASGLRRSLADGQSAVAMIVSRDTGTMTGPQVARSAIESGAENFSDGVIAPAFWFLVAGLPGLLAYKMINTADSMIGYRNHRYEEFGKVSARTDDLLNLIPARLTGLLIAVISGQLRHCRAIVSDAKGHRSPNAGWPEAAMARALNLALSGPRSYDGQMREFPWVNGTANKAIGAHDIDACSARLWQVWGLVLTMTVALVLLF
ncbi:adenosylcobinamide-phosphate synthase CbiB [Parasedimentitalea psychrophila]|uniref:Cobalamin biosynthesis protein CobD n=1 Tax=Parasedimentitalea psychrophila TaxID=2997337 RepID=A0A9Y2L334_9RHOB|nr:adenosylcobinamide-phosphate synthase CbiB [Parasedimentitalea psychrophila]WIY26497.1 adenosylcobinamide-phosphate synthase CbiB [Parasedimentitalea psychrophila]